MGKPCSIILLNFKIGRPTFQFITWHEARANTINYDAMCVTHDRPRISSMMRDRDQISRVTRDRTS